MARDARIDIRLQASEKEAWEAYARALEIKLSELIRQAVREYLEKRELT